MTPSFSTGARVPVLVGPTGVGKSEVAFELARKLGAEILSADAFQVYRGLPIGTAQPSEEYQKKVVHHLTACLDFSQNWSAVEFAKKASFIIQEALAQNRKMILVGGSGFYLKALVEGVPVGEAPSAELRSWIAEKMAQMTPQALRQWLLERTPEAAARIHENDLYRIGRALEKSYGPDAPTSTPILDPGLFRFYGLERDRARLDELLRARVKKMWDSGLLAEVEFLNEKGIDPEHPVWSAIGYQEGRDYLNAQMTLALALEKMFRRTRQYAKRQWTWFKHHHAVQWINLDQWPRAGEAADFILEDMTKS